MTLAAGTSLKVTSAVTIDNAVTLTGDASVQTDVDVTLAGALAANGHALTKVGTGTLTVTSATGGMSVGAGTVAVATAAALSGTVTLSGGTLDVTGATVAITNAITLGASNGTVNTAGAVTLSGGITGTGNLTKTGTGTVTVTGANSYTGTTAISGGTLAVNGTMTGTGAVTVSSGATLGGSGSIAGAVSIASGGFIAAGNSPGKLTLTGGLTISAGGSLVAELNGTVAGTSYDQIDVTGTVTITGAKLTLSLGYTPTANDTFVLIANDGTDAIVGTLKTSDGFTLAEGDTVTSGIYTFRVSYVGGTGNDLTLTVLNFAPVLDATPSPTLTGIAEDVADASNTGATVSSLVTGAITDQDGTAVSAIAVTAVDNTNGAWQYSTDNGTTWNAFGTVTAATARLLDGTLTGNDTQKIRFVPTLNYNGSATITFRAWDKSTGTAGSTADTSTGNGGNSAYSSVTDTASITISAVNDTPVLTTPTAISLTDTSATDAFSTNQTGTLAPPTSKARR